MNKMVFLLFGIFLSLITQAATLPRDYQYHLITESKNLHLYRFDPSVGEMTYLDTERFNSPIVEVQSFPSGSQEASLVIRDFISQIWIKEFNSATKLYDPIYPLPLLIDSYYMHVQNNHLYFAINNSLAIFSLLSYPISSVPISQMPTYQLPTGVDSISVLKIIPIGSGLNQVLILTKSDLILGSLDHIHRKVDADYVLPLSHMKYILNQIDVEIEDIDNIIANSKGFWITAKLSTVNLQNNHHSVLGFLYGTISKKQLNLVSAHPAYNSTDATQPIVDHVEMLEIDDQDNSLLTRENLVNFKRRKVFYNFGSQAISEADGFFDPAFLSTFYSNTSHPLNIITAPDIAYTNELLKVRPSVALDRKVTEYTMNDLLNIHYAKNFLKKSVVQNQPTGGMSNVDDEEPITLREGSGAIHNIHKTSIDFENQFNHEAKKAGIAPLPKTENAWAFVSRVNQSFDLVYEFKGISADLLKEFGFEYRDGGLYLRKPDLEIDTEKVIEVLVQHNTQVSCEKKLTKK